MLLRQAFLKSRLLLQLTILMDELRITSAAERSFSWFLHVTQSTQNTPSSLGFIHVLTLKWFICFNVQMFWHLCLTTDSNINWFFLPTNQSNNHKILKTKQHVITEYFPSESSCVLVSQTCLFSTIQAFQCVLQLSLQSCCDCLPVVAQNALQVVLYQRLCGCRRITDER